MDKLRLKVFHDWDAECPFDSWDTICVVVLWSKTEVEAYVHETMEVGEWPELGDVALAQGLMFRVGVGASPHVTLSRSVDPIDPEKEQGEWGGVVYASPEKGEFHSMGHHQLVTAIDAELHAFNQWSEGNTWFWATKKVCQSCGQVEGDVVESCSGFIGEDLEEVGMEVPDEVKDQLEAAWAARFDSNW